MTSDAPTRDRLDSPWPAAIYAVGDVHGCLTQLRLMEQQIVAEAAPLPGEKILLMLGDYVDRGPESAGVIAHLLTPPPDGFRRICLAGNHEQAMLDFLDNPSANTKWIGWGGQATAESYGLPADTSERWRNDPISYADALRALLPADHLTFLRTLPIWLSVPGYLFVHAGIRPGVPLANQTDYDLMWIRPTFLDALLPRGLTIVHGHTPVEVPEITRHRIDIDTGCCIRGTLTGLRVTPGGETKFFSATA